MTLQIAFVATYPPRRCGIATFTRDLNRAVGGGRVIAIRDQDEPGPDPLEVLRQVSRDEPVDYLRAAREVNRSDIDVVSLQHEYGIFGGRDGAHILGFVEALEVPVAATLHTVLRRPTASQRAVLAALGERVAAVVAMSRGAADLLAEVYDVDPDKIRVIRHGVPDLPLVDPDGIKPELGLAGREVILSFGLLGPGKGYEQVIEAMATVRDARPRTLFVILGASHPELVRREGEAYRDRLRQRVDDLGLTGHVRFEDRFVTTTELGRWLLAADVFVTPYPG
ncbi:MAG: glycosyltransferase, partial [Chloroflexota bacterium]|nr:glycosyltransferase [Chloroflexota bacterium]